MDGWIVVPNWDKYQSYKDREPKWIKLHLALNSDDDWLGITIAERGMLTTIWVEYARSRGQLRVGKVMQLCGKSARSKHVTSLSHAGFIRIVGTKPLAHARSREEKKNKSKNPLPPSEKGDLSNDLKPGGKHLSAKELRRYTGCSFRRGSHGTSYIQDVLGTDKPPADWPHPPPSRKEVELHLEFQDR